MGSAFGVRTGLIGFAASSLLGSLSGSDFEAVIWQSLTVLIVLFVFGAIVGLMAGMAVEESARREFERQLADLNVTTAG